MQWWIIVIVVECPQPQTNTPPNQKFESQSTGGITGDVLSCGDNTYTVFLDLGLVDGTVVTLSGKAVKLIDNDRVLSIVMRKLAHRHL